MKRFLALFLLLSLTACGAPEAYETSLSAAKVPPSAPVTARPEPELEPESEPEPDPRTVDPCRPMVALTFDDGPHPEYTEQLLNILEEQGAVATFFEVAQNLPKAPEAVQRAAELGCEIGSHSYRHADLGRMSAEQIQEDIQAADAAFIQVLGSAPTLLRPPYGSTSKTLRATSGRPLVTWSIDPEDWRCRNAEQVVSHLQSFDTLDGQVILLHSIYGSTVEAAETLVPWLLEQGYQLVTLSELITLRFADQVEENRIYGFDYFRFQVPPLPEEEAPENCPAAPQ